MDFLIHVNAAGFENKQWNWNPVKKHPLTVGDHFLFVLAFWAMEGSDIVQAWRQVPAFRDNGLCWLMFPREFGDDAQDATPNFTPWLNPQGVAILEALQQTLAARWIAVEQEKARMVNANLMRRLGDSQHAVLTALTTAAMNAGRLDLTRCLLIAAHRLLRHSPTADAWIRQLEVQSLRLADRVETYRAALTFTRFVETEMQAWQTHARNVGFYDEDYQASQLWKATWEHYQGDQLLQAAANINQVAEPLTGDFA